MRALAALLILIPLLPATAAGPAPRGSAPALIVDSLDLLELEPLVITAPRMKIPERAVIDSQINMHLLRLLRNRADARVEAQHRLDASMASLSKLSTATGFKLKTRYTELGFLLTEGLAGVKDFALANELERVARLGTNVQTRAAAMVALAYTKDQRYLGLFQGAINDQNITVRFGALEALVVMGGPSVQFLISNTARNDASPALRAHAAVAMWRAGDIYGREILLRMYQDPDWLTRAMATTYLGELGGDDEYRRLMRQLDTEQDPIVKAALCSALLRLQQSKNSGDTAEGVAR
ncbi:MAG: HEAT repeat domain-containing protein [Elusimicrobiota bacterium]